MSESRPMNTSISDLRLSMLDIGTRARGALHSEGIHDVETLCQTTPFALMSLPGMGRVSLDRIRAALKEHGLRLKDDRGVGSPDGPDTRKRIASLAREVYFTDPSGRDLGIEWCIRRAVEIDDALEGYIAGTVKP